MLLSVVVFGMVACTSGPATVDGGNTTSTLSGTVATGAPLYPATITILGANGVTVTAQADQNGLYTRDVSTLTAPYLLRVPDPLISNSYLFSVATSAGTANIHPFTDLIIKSWYKVQGVDIETQFTGAFDATKLPTVAGINTIEAVIRSVLSTSFANAGVPADFNLMSGQFNANHAGFDKLLDQTKVVIATDGGVTIQAVDKVIDPITGLVSGTGATSILATTTINTLPTAAADTAAPTAPANLVASPASTTSILLAWTASTDAVGVAGYNIYRAPASGGVLVLIDTSPFPAYNDTGLAVSTLYCYQVEAFDAVTIANISARSAVSCATTPTAADTTAPAAPTSLAATAHLSLSQINLTWVASSSGDTVGYDINRNGFNVATTNITSYSDTGLASNTLYNYSIMARDAAGNASGASNSASATTAPGVPSAPANVQAVAGNQQVTISWSAVSGATSYKMYMDTVSGISKTTTTPSVMHHPSVSSPFLHTALTNGTHYFFVVTAVNASGESIESVEVQAMPALAALAGGIPMVWGQVDATWGTAKWQ